MTLGRTITQWALTLHIYVSLAGFLLLFLFAVTGLTLNHGDFGLSGPHVVKSTIRVPTDLVAHPSEESIGRHFTTELGVSAPVTSYREYPEEIEILFAAPGRRTQVLVNRSDGTAQVEVESRGFLGVIGDLHKGRESGRIWSWVIDGTAVIFVFTSLTGLVTLTSLRTRRRLGFLLGLAGAVVAFAIYLAWVPR